MFGPNISGLEKNISDTFIDNAEMESEIDSIMNYHFTKNFPKKATRFS